MKGLWAGQFLLTNETDGRDVVFVEEIVVADGARGKSMRTGTTLWKAMIDHVRESAMEMCLLA